MTNKYHFVFDGPGIPLNEIQRNAINQINYDVYSGALVVERVNECFCGSSNFETVSKYDRFGLPFGTQICKTCGLISQTMRLHPDSLPKFYEEIYWPLVMGVHESEFLTEPKEDTDVAYIQRHLPEKIESVTVFEVGCGSGNRLRRIKKSLQDDGKDVVSIGCDYSSNALRMNQDTDIQTVQGGMSELAAYGKADVLILSHVFEHIPDLILAMENMSALTHEGSIIYIEVPGVIDLENKKEYLYNYQLYCVLAHTYNFSLGSLTAVMNKGGFSLVSGDEYVRSIFKKGTFSNSKLRQSCYEKTMNAIQRATRKSQQVTKNRNQPFIKYSRNLAKAVLGR